MIRRPPRSTQSRSSAASDVYKRQRGKDVDQLKAIKELLPQGVSRRRQAITWIPERDLLVKEDQPCLQRLWVRDIGNGNAEMHCMWRSRDLFAAWNSNICHLY